MSVRKKLILAFSVICLLVLALLGLNSFMAREEGRYVARLLAIHHQHAALLNVKNAVSRQLSEAQDIFLYGKSIDGAAFQDLTRQIGREVQNLAEAMTVADNLPTLAGSGGQAGEGRRRIERLQRDYEDLNRELMLMVTLFQNGRKAKAQEHFQVEIARLFAGFFAQIDSWLLVQKEDLGQTESRFAAMNQGHNRTSLLALAAIMGVVLFFFVLIASLLGPRLRELLRGTERISKGDFSQPVRVEGQDEFTRLSLAMNQMMADLAASRKKLLEQSYYSGMADMVSGTLHNLRNALAPIVIELEGQKQVLDGLRLSQMAQACAELAVQGEEERRRDLVEYLGLACAQMRHSLHEMGEAMLGTRNKVAVVEKILNQHSHLARLERPLETVPLVEAVQDSLGLVRQDALGGCAVRLDDSLALAGPVICQRIVLVQVLANLIGNGLESVLRGGAATGEVVVRAVSSGGAGAGRMVHVEVTDTGVGIAPEMLERIFERGVSAKEGGGLGLHWCANATASLGGRLYAESLGPGRGATLHLILQGGQWSPNSSSRS